MKALILLLLVLPVSAVAQSQTGTTNTEIFSFMPGAIPKGLEFLDKAPSLINSDRWDTGSYTPRADFHHNVYNVSDSKKKPR